MLKIKKIERRLYETLLMVISLNTSSATSSANLRIKLICFYDFFPAQD